MRKEEGVTDTEHFERIQKIKGRKWVQYYMYNIFCPHWIIVLDNLYEFMMRYLSLQFCQVGVFQRIFFL